MIIPIPKYRIQWAVACMHIMSSCFYSVLIDNRRGDVGSFYQGIYNARCLAVDVVIRLVKAVIPCHCCSVSASDGPALHIRLPLAASQRQNERVPHVLITTVQDLVLYIDGG